MASLHIFGSSPHGPYPFIDTRHDPYAATVPRISKAMTLYFEQIGQPTRVILNTVLWDTRECHIDEGVGWNVSSPKFLKTVADFRKDFNDRLDDIESILSANSTFPRIDLGLLYCYARLSLGR